LIDPAAGRLAVIAYIDANAPWPKDRYQVEFVREHAPLAAATAEVEPRLAQPPSGALAGVHTFDVNYVHDGQVVARGAFTVKIKATGTVYLAAHPLTRGATLAETDVVAKEVELANVRGVPETDLQKIVGARVARPLVEGQLVTADSVEAKLAVRRGDAVMLVARRGEMTVTAFGIARENGSIGKVIPVMNLQSKKIVYGRVESASAVAVLL
jgi:flagella basal body P-ring formation protein FlgA